MLAIFAQGGATLFLIAVTLCVPLANVFQEIKFFAGSTYTGFTLEGFSYFNMGLVALGNFVYNDLGTRGRRFHLSRLLQGYH